MGTRECLYPITIRNYNYKDIEYIIKRHQELYEVEHGFSSEFEGYVKEYVMKFHENHDEIKENIWIAEQNGRPVGVIALVKVDDDLAQLRWFLIEPEMRGQGLGHKLMSTLIDFSKEKNYKHIFLWTISILESARHLYKNYNFKLTETKKSDIWGAKLIEERWDLHL